MASQPLAAGGGGNDAAAAAAPNGISVTTPQPVPAHSTPSERPSSQHHHQSHPAGHGIGRSRTGSTVRASTSGENSLSDRSTSPFRPRRGTMSSETWRTVRTLPTWVDSRDDDEDDSGLLPFPARAHRRPPERSVHDSQRECVPVTPAYQRQPTNVWRNYVESSSIYPPNTAHSEKVDLSRQGDLDSPWLSGTRPSGDPGDGAADDHEGLFVSKKRRQIWYKRIHVILLNSPTVPLFFRLIIWILSLLALSLAGSIFHLSNSYGFPQKPSTVMAIVVDAIALIYLIYVTWDEYSGKPLGLRSPNAKIRLIMLDLLFIVFDSANLSLAFDTLYDVRWSCLSVDTSEDFKQNKNSLRTVDPICDRQRALAAFLFLALGAWVVTFMISVFRVVERVSSRS